MTSAWMAEATMVANKTSSDQYQYYLGKKLKSKLYKEMIFFQI